MIPFERLTLPGPRSSDIRSLQMEPDVLRQDPTVIVCFGPRLCGRWAAGRPSVPGSRLASSRLPVPTGAVLRLSPLVLRASRSGPPDSAPVIHRGADLAREPLQRRLEPAAPVSPDHPLSRCHCQAEASPQGTEASSLISQDLQPAGAALQSSG